MLQTPLMRQIADIGNLNRAFQHCQKGKRKSVACQNFFLSMPEVFHFMRENILNACYPWLPYHKIKVFDPKERDILVAPFRDRVLHQAISQVIAPSIDKAIPNHSFACRKGMGNRHAVLKLHDFLKTLGSQRYCIKLDIKRYFDSIDHHILMERLKTVIHDPPVLHLLMSLIESHEPFRIRKCGIPIGNVSSQHFANLYLSPIDQLAQELDSFFYIRYMDDMVIVADNKRHASDLCALLKDKISSLKLTVPKEKTVLLGNDPIPFLGFLVSHHFIRPLSRNIRRHKRQVHRMIQGSYPLSHIEEVKTSFQAWKALQCELPS